MFALVKDGQVVRTSDGTQKLQDYAWSTLRELTRDQRIADGWFDFVQANIVQPAFGFHSGGVTLTIDAVAGTVTEVQQADIPMDAATLAIATKAKKIADMDALTALITDRMWEDESVGSTDVFSVTHPNFAGLTATQAIAKVHADKAVIRATL